MMGKALLLICACGENQDYHKKYSIALVPKRTVSRSWAPETHEYIPGLGYIHKQAFDAGNTGYSDTHLTITVPPLGRAEPHGLRMGITEPIGTADPIGIAEPIGLICVPAGAHTH